MLTQGCSKNKCSKLEFQPAQAIIEMAHNLNLALIAKGVETHKKLSFRHKCDCDEVKGYLLRGPMSARQLDKLLLAK